MRIKKLTILTLLILYPIISIAQYYILNVGDAKEIEIIPINDIISEEWNSSDPSVVEVVWAYGAKAKIKALKPTEKGQTVTISCFYQYYKNISLGTQASYTERISVQVIGINPTEISIPQNKTLHLGDTWTIIPNIIPNNAYATFTWSSSNTSVATVNSSGIVIPKGFGETVITVTTDNNLSATCVVTVEKVNATSISVISYKKMIVGDSETIKYNIYPSNSNNVITWSSSDESVASVTQQGVVTAKRTGTADIKVETDNGISDICTVTVPVLPEKITLPEKVEVNLYKKVQLKALLTPQNSLDYLQWSSDNEDVATVAPNGIVIGNAIGEARITVRGKNATDVSTTCVVTVKEPKYQLIVWATDGSKVSYQLNKHPVLTYDNDNIILSTTETVVEYKAEDICKYTFEDFERDVNAVQQSLVTPVDARMSQQRDMILFEQCEPLSSVQIYAINGRLMSTYKIGEDGTLQIFIGQYPRGIYIIKTKHLTHKIIKR